jgi:phenylacetic acid degradation operon negative regulatory protein
MAAPAESLPPDRAGSPSSLIVTFAGCYLRRIDGWIAVADLIDCLGLAGISEPAVRQALVRLKSRGFLDAERRSGVAGYRLTPAGEADLSPGDRRIFRYGQADPEAGWVLAVFSVPEDRRHHRHQLRSQLGWLGFGAVGPGVWVAPAPLEVPARDLLRAGELDRYVTWFRATTVSAPDVARWWDLDGLRCHYERFLATWTPRIDAAAVAADGAAAFAGYLHLVDDWRLLPRIDPGLPAELLPDTWPGPEAWRVFSTLRQRWEAIGLAYLRKAVATRVPAEFPALSGPEPART